MLFTLYTLLASLWHLYTKFFDGGLVPYAWGSVVHSGKIELGDFSGTRKKDSIQFTVIQGTVIQYKGIQHNVIEV